MEILENGLVAVRIGKIADVILYDIIDGEGILVSKGMGMENRPIRLITIKLGLTIQKLTGIASNIDKSCPGENFSK